MMILRPGLVASVLVALAPREAHPFLIIPSIGSAGAELRRDGPSDRWIGTYDDGASRMVTTTRRSRGLLMSSSSSSSSSGSPSAAPQSTETVFWIRGLSNTWDGQRYQFKDITLSLGKGQKVGLVGVNGCGKSTLLRAIAGLEKCEGGEIERVKGLSVVYVDQEPVFPPGTLVKDAVFSGDGKEMSIVREYQRSTEALGGGGEGADQEAAYERFQKATAMMDSIQGWDIETYANQVMERLNVLHLQDKVTEHLSGGERKRVGLASSLVRKPDVLLLDEPSNHMDVEAIEWLEGFLRQREQTYIVVTHDRYFLEAVCNDIWELEDSQLYRYTGNYESFLEAKAARLSAFEAQRSADLKKLQRELEWMRKQPKARLAKSKAREAAFYDLASKTEKKTDGKGKLSLQAAQARLGNFILALNNANLRFDGVGGGVGKSILQGFTYEFAKGDRVGVVGPNGVGKTSFLKTLVGAIPLDSGEVLKGETVRFGVYNQMGMDFPPDCRVLDLVKDAAEEALANQAAAVGGTTDPEDGSDGVGGRGSGEALARQLLQRFQFPVNRWQDVVAKLSGGEKRRLQLLWVLVQRPNFLILDEPSNDLDLGTLASLEEFLNDEYQGVLVTVSHDRRFMDKVVRHLFVFEGEGVVRDFQGSFTEYLDLIKEMQAEKKESAAAAASQGSEGQGSKSNNKAAAPRRLTSKEKKELGGMEAAIEALEKQRQEYQDNIDRGHQANVGYGELAEWTNRMQKLTEEIAAKEERWMELMEMNEAAAAARGGG